MFTAVMSNRDTLIVSENSDVIDLAPYVRGGYLNLLLVVNAGVVIQGPATISGAPINDLTPQPRPQSSVWCSEPITVEGSTLTIVNHGSIRGINGQGAAPGSMAGVGGSAVEVDAVMSVFNYGTIHAGGGGGGSGTPSLAYNNDLQPGGGGGFLANGWANQDGVEARYGYAAGGIGVIYTPEPTIFAGDGGACNGYGLAGDDGLPNQLGVLFPSHLGAPGGSSIDAKGRVVTVVSGLPDIKGVIV